MPAKRTLFLSLLTLALIVTACTAPAVTSTPTPLPPTKTPIPETPTATQVPLAATVNGDGIPLEEYNASLAQLKQAAADQKANYTDEQLKQIVLDDLVAQTLLVHSAYVDGFNADQSAVDAKISDLAAKMGGIDALEKWITQNGYSDSSFRQVIIKDLAAEFEKEKIMAAIGSTADQVHARQILVSTEAAANQVIAALQSGSDFATLANQYDQVTGGELGWFPKGYLTQPLVEVAAFGLQPGQFSGVIKTDVGYHIVYVIERDPAHSLSADAMKVLQHQVLENWIAQQKTDSVINIVVP